MKTNELIKILSKYPADFEIRTQHGEDIIHIINSEEAVILSSKKPVGYCPHCGEYVYPSSLVEYAAYCPVCDEDFYSFEVAEVNAQ